MNEKVSRLVSFSGFILKLRKSVFGAESYGLKVILSKRLVMQMKKQL